MPTCPHLAAGGPPTGLNWVQAEGPPDPFALVRAQTSFAHGDECPSAPPKMIIRLLPGSYPAESPYLGAGGVPLGWTATQFRRPAREADGRRRHTSFKLFGTNFVSPAEPPNTIICFVNGSSTAEWPHLGRGPLGSNVGYPNARTLVPQEILVDYVRVYQR